MKKIIISYLILILTVAVSAQSPSTVTPAVVDQSLTQTVVVDSAKTKTQKNKPGRHRRFIQAADTLTASDYMLSIERVNDNLNSIRDSAKLGFEVIGMSRKLDNITKDISRIRLNIRDKHSVINIRNLYLYQNFAATLDNENEGIQSRLNKIYSKVYHSKLRMRKVLNDSI